jgi:hypothetical protein
MVRRNELACRDEWSRSLWQPRDEQHSNGDMPFQRRAPEPLLAASAENLHSILNGDVALAASSQGEDVLLSEARIVSEAHETWEPPQRPFPTGHFDPRTAIFRAREAYRERVRAKTFAERQSAVLEAMIGSPSTEDFASSSGEETTAGLDDRVPHEPTAASADEHTFQPLEAESRLTEPVEAALPVIGPTLPATEVVSGQAVSEDPFLFTSDVHLLGPEVERPTAAGTGKNGMPATATRRIEEADSAKAEVELAERETLPDWYRADLPRICRTCRDYRPSAEGQRGWCANSWAFTHRRLVLDDDLAPCQSAIGDWWLPVDDVWLVAADVSSHGRATPLLDRMTAKADQQRRRS